MEPCGEACGVDVVFRGGREEGCEVRVRGVVGNFDGLEGRYYGGGWVVGSCFGRITYLFDPKIHLFDPNTLFDPHIQLFDLHVQHSDPQMH